MNPNQPDQPMQPTPPQQPVPPAPAQPAVLPQPQMPSPAPGQNALPPQPAVATGGFLPPFPGQAPQKQGRKLPKWLLIVVPAVLVVVIAGVVAFLLLGKSFPLETYKGTNYSVLVPKDYEKTTIAGSTAFKEGADDEDTESAVVVNSEAYGYKPTSSQLDDVKGYIKDNAESLIKDSVSSSRSHKLKDFNVDETTVNGKDALRIVANVEKDGKKVGTMTGVIVFGDDSMYMVMVAAHQSDKALSKNANKIIDSLKIED